MIHFDRRRWLQGLGLIGALGVSRGLRAQASPSSPAAGSEPVRVRLSLNENPFGPSPAVIAALQREAPNLCRYTDAEYADLVAAIARRENVPADQIILGEILEPLGTYLGLQGGPGGEFIFSDPGYTALIDSAVAVGGRAVGVPLAKMANDLAALAARVDGRTRAVFLVNPHNPTGTVSDGAQLKEFAHATSRRTLVIVDEAYLEFADHFAERTLADLVRNGDNVIVFRTFAKVYGLAGLDIGYGLLPKAIAGALSAQGLTNPHLFNRLAVAAASASLRDSRYVNDVVLQVTREREQWFELFHDLKLDYTPSQGNFVFFESSQPHAQFAAALMSQGVEIGRAFPPYDQWARVSIGLPEENAIARAAVRASLRTAAA